MKGLAFFLLLCHFTCYGQLECPNLFKREKSHYFQPFASDLVLEGGVKQPFLYSNPGGNTNSNYSFGAAPKIYLGSYLSIPITNDLGVLAGVQLTENKQGLSFRYNDDGDEVTEKQYNSSLLIRFKMGLYYSFTRSFKINLSPVLIRSSYWETQSTGAFQANANIQSFDYSWRSPDSYDLWYWGLDLSAAYRIFNKVYADLNFSIDFKHSVTLSGEANIQFTDGRESHYEGSINPYLFYAGIGIRYRVFEKL